MSIFSKICGLFATPSAPKEPDKRPKPSMRISKKVENTWLRNDFARGEDVFSAAFRQVMRGISMDDCLQDKISQALYDSLNAGGREQEKKLYSVLKGKAWSWPDLANWQEHFQSAGEWPYMWRGDHLNPTSHEGILCRCPIDGVTSWELARHIDKKTLRGTLDRLNIPYTTETKVADMRVMVRSIPVSDLRGALPDEVYRQAEEKVSDDLLWAKCKLLAHTVIMRHGKLTMANRCTPSPQKYRPFQTTCPVERKFGEKWVRGELIGLPPFFPGDRTSFLLRNSSLHFR